jgi:hypothetical protein
VADTTYDDSPEDFGPADESGGSFGFQVGFEAPQDALGCYYWDGVEDAIYASDECDLDGSIFDFAGNQNPLAPDTVMAATTVALPQAFEYEDPTLEVDGEDFYWATGPPLPDDTGQTTSYYPDQDIDDPEPESYGTFGNFQRPADLVASQILGGTFPDDDPDADADELDTGSKFDYQLPIRVVPDRHRGIRRPGRRVGVLHARRHIRGRGNEQWLVRVCDPARRAGHEPDPQPCADRRGRGTRRARRRLAL